MTNQDNPNQDGKRRTKVSQSEFPNNSLQQGLRIAQAIWDDFAGKGAAPHQIAMSIDMSPTSGTWRNLCGSSIAYGLTEGGYNAAEITLTELGRRIVAPTEEGNDAIGRVEAMLKPRISGEFYRKYNRAKFPKDEIAKNVLVSLGLPKDRSDAAFEILKSNGEFSGVIHETKTGSFVAIEDPAPKSTMDSPTLEARDSSGGAPGVVTSEAQQPAAEAAARTSPTTPPKAPRDEGQKKIFVAHGKNRKPLEDLKKILNEFNIPYKVAVDEAHAGRPISAKVAELMKECSAGLFIFTKDEHFQREQSGGTLEDVWRPSENVVYELGAASILWDRKIIILREDGVNFPSDFSDLGYITFNNGEISAKALELLKELVALGLVRFQAA